MIYADKGRRQTCIFMRNNSLLHKNKNFIWQKTSEYSVEQLIFLIFILFFSSKLL